MNYYPASEVGGSSREELPHAPMPEARDGGRAGGPTPRPSSSGPAGAGGLRGTIPC